jgi:hypothetical protein
MYCMALKVYTCEEAASGPNTFLNIFFKLLQQKETSPAWLQYQLTLLQEPRPDWDSVHLQNFSAKTEFAWAP